MNIGKMLREGLDRYNQEHAEREQAKLGILRGGNSGILARDGGSIGVSGQCHRKTYLRLKGISLEDIPEDRDIMFDFGRRNEDFWYDTLAPIYKHRILREEEIPISWKTSNGTLVTGRPDIVLCDGKGKPKLGLELKMASSFWTTREILMGRPKQPHLIQAAHYSWQLNVPFQLWYTNPVDQIVTGWLVRRMLSKEEWAQVHIDLKNDTKDQEMAVVKPFQVGFETKWEGEEFHFRRAGSKEPWQATIITKKRIEEYYEFISTMEERNDLGPRPENLKFNGEKMGWKFCDSKYCPLAATCKQHESKGLREWTEQVKLAINPSSNKED